MPGKKNSKAVQRQSDGSSSIIAQAEYYSGPLPHPAMLAQYDSILPGAPERILAMVEAQGRHRQQLEEYALKAEHHRSMTGVVLAGVMVLAMLGTAGYALYLNLPNVALALAGTPIVTIAGAFIYGTESRKRERIQKTRIMAEAQTGRR